METTYSFEDVLTGATVACGYPNLRSHYVGKAQGAMECESVFFPGCSFINYGLPLVQAVFDTLKQGGCVQGMSLLCCGKILSYEPNGKEVRASFEQQLRQHLLASGVKRLVAACPNCVKALRDACAADSATAEIEVVPLPQELARLGYRIDPATAQALMAAEVPEELGWCFAPMILAPTEPQANLQMACVPWRKTFPWKNRPIIVRNQCAAARWRVLRVITTVRSRALRCVLKKRCKLRQTC